MAGGAQRGPTPWPLARATPLAVWGLVIAQAGLGVTTIGVTAVSAWQTNKVLSMSPGQSTSLGGNTVTMAARQPDRRAQL